MSVARNKTMVNCAVLRCAHWLFSQRAFGNQFNLKKWLQLYSVEPRCTHTLMRARYVNTRRSHTPCLLIWLKFIWNYDKEKEEKKNWKRMAKTPSNFFFLFHCLQLNWLMADHNDQRRSMKIYSMADDSYVIAHQNR